MGRRANLGRRAAERAHRVDQLGRRVVMATLAAVVAGLVGRLAVGARAADEAVGEKRPRLGIVQLLDVFRLHEPRLADRLPDLFAQRAIFGAVGAAVVVELDVEVGEVALVGRLHLGDQFLFADAGLPGADHDRRAVRVVGAEVEAVVADELLESHPDVGLDVLDQVADVDRAVGVGQGGGDEDSTHDRGVLRVRCIRSAKTQAAKWLLAAECCEEQAVAGRHCSPPAEIAGGHAKGPRAGVERFRKLRDITRPVALVSNQPGQTP